MTHSVSLYTLCIQLKLKMAQDSLKIHLREIDHSEPRCLILCIVSSGSVPTCSTK